MSKEKRKQHKSNLAEPMGGIVFATNKACKDCVFAFAQGRHDPLNGTCDVYYSKPYEVAFEGKPCERYQNANAAFEDLEKRLSEYLKKREVDTEG